MAGRNFLKRTTEWVYLVFCDTMHRAIHQKLKNSKEAALKGVLASDFKRLPFAGKHNFDAAQPAAPVRRLISPEIH